MLFKPGTANKTNRVLQIILAAFLMIAFRVWHLEVIQREDKLKQAERPKRRAIVLKADRGTICDRFHIPLAVNKICYKACVYYNQIAQIPAVSWKEDPQTGKRVRCTPRRDYIRDLSAKLAEVLHLDPLRIEDLIHSKASLLPHVPFVIKSFLSEPEHYRLAILEKDWLGVHAEISSERFYPKGRTACEILGTMGSISSKEYFSIVNEIEAIQSIVDDWEMGLGFQLPVGATSFDQAVRRLQELKEKAYTIQDLVGKTGIEGHYERHLRGFYGKKIYEIDQKGKFLRELPGGRDHTPGHQITLTISSELQEFAESLLAQHEATRDGKSIGLDADTNERKALKQPWIKGASIVAMDPNTGEVLAMASTPRFDPNDFIPATNSAIHQEKQQRIGRWLENERTIGAIWDGRAPLLRERFTPAKGFFDEGVSLSWDFFLQSILPTSGPLKNFFTRVDDVKTAIQIQEDFETVLFYSGLREPAALLDALYPQVKIERHPDAAAALKRLETHLNPLASNGDRLLSIDLCRLVVHAPAFTDECLKVLGSMKLNQYRACNQAICQTETQLKEQAALLFHNQEFSTWREANQKEFLTLMRKREKENKVSPRPYLDYLDQKEKELFDLYWKEKRLDALAAHIPEPLVPLCSRLSSDEVKAVLHTFRSFSDLQRPLLGSYRLLRKKRGEQTEKELAAAFYPIGGFGHSRSYSFQAATQQGSIFKLITAYAAMQETGGHNPLTIIDEVTASPFSVAKSLSGSAYPRSYKGGRLPRSVNPKIGKIDVVAALEQTSNPYFALLAGDVLKDPEDLAAAARLFGYGSPTGIDLPGEGSGKVPNDLSRNRTGLYSTAIGQHTLLSTPLQTAVMLSTIANGGEVLKPRLTKQISGPIPDRAPWAAFEHPAAIAQKELQFLGLGFPLFTGAIARSEIPSIHTQEAEVSRSLKFPSSIRQLLLDGMDRVVWGSNGTARPAAIRGLSANPEILSQFLGLRHQMIGKTSTAEVLVNPNINPSSRPSMYKHVWFGSIAFDQSRKFDHPELVVVVYLRYGSGGKEAAPLAAQMITKWREIKSKHSRL